MLAPRLGLTWDPWGDERVARLNAGVFYSRTPRCLRLADHHQRQGQSNCCSSPDDGRAHLSPRSTALRERLRAAVGRLPRRLISQSAHPARSSRGGARSAIRRDARRSYTYAA
jgi:hypothetical protein